MTNGYDCTWFGEVSRLINKHDQRQKKEKPQSRVVSSVFLGFASLILSHGVRQVKLSHILLIKSSKGDIPFHNPQKTLHDGNNRSMMSKVPNLSMMFRVTVEIPRTYMFVIQPVLQPFRSECSFHLG